MLSNNYKSVLIGVLKTKRDLSILLKNHWYRIPLFYSPKIKARYIAFYQPASFGKSGSCIRYYAKIHNYKIVKRKELLPDEYDHPYQEEDYYKIIFSKICKLPKPILNKNRVRVSFGFTTLEKLLNAEGLAEAKDITQLFDIHPLERILEIELKKRNIKFFNEYNVYLATGKRYRLDFAIFCKKGCINIECDSSKWHSIKSQRIRDIQRDKELKKSGWIVLRLTENEIINNIDKCIKKINRNIENLLN